MAGIAGIDQDGKPDLVKQMLGRISHRGQAGTKLIFGHSATLGVNLAEIEKRPAPPTLERSAVWDGASPPLPEPKALEHHVRPFALAAAGPDGLFLARDPLGIRPLYYGRTEKGALCVASEVKALLDWVPTVHEFPPGQWYTPQKGFQTFYAPKAEPDLEIDADRVASALQLRLEQAVCRRAGNDALGCWLSGGPASAALAALVRPHAKTLHTFSAGMAGTSAREYARGVAYFLDAEHREITVELDELLAILPEVIYHLESFDAGLVRCAIINYLVSRAAADHVGEVFCAKGRGALLRRYLPVKDSESEKTEGQAPEPVQRLHNTVLQAIDGSAGAHGVVVHLPFLDPDVVEFALRIPADLDVRGREETGEPWLLRLILHRLFPDRALGHFAQADQRSPCIGDTLARHAEQQISDEEYSQECSLPNGWVIRDKEELMYYRVFQSRFGDMDTLSWMGRTQYDTRAPLSVDAQLAEMGGILEEE